MKKQLKTLIVTISISLSVLFATKVKAQFSGGVRAGVNFATEQYTGFEHEFLALPYAGLFAQYRAGQIALQLGANYSGQGNNVEDLSSGDTYHDRQSYFTIPFLIQERFPFGGYIELGAQYGFLLSSTSDFDNQGAVDSKNNFSSTDFAVGGGIGYEFNHKSSSGLGINIRYMRGLTTITNLYEGNDVKSRVLSAGLNYRF
jgi:hypothetical protein